LVDRFNGAPRHEKYRKYKQGIFKVSRKTGSQLMEIFKKLLLLGQGLIPANDWYGIIPHVWDMGVRRRVLEPGIFHKYAIVMGKCVEYSIAGAI